MYFRDTFKKHSFAILLLIGILARITALNQPLINAALLRQCQTAYAAREIIREPGFPLATAIPWHADSGAKLVQEIPTYNYLVIAVNSVVRNLDMSGKVTSVLLWALSFWLLQGLWRRILRPEEVVWANLMFVFSPLSNFFGQAFMPEMVVQVLAFGFLLALLRYSESRRMGDFLLLSLTGALAILQKAPETSHLYLVAGAVILGMHGMKLVRRPEYWLALIVTAMLAKAWGGYMDSVNSAGAPELTASEALRVSIGTLDERVSLHFYRRVAGYVGIFLITPVCVPFVLGGLVRMIRERRHVVAWSWVASLVFFYLLWGPRTAGEHTYYNLPALGPACLLFGMGVTGLQRWLRERVASASARAWIGAAITLAAAPFPLAVTAYFYMQDQVIYDCAHWLRQNTAPEDHIIYVGGHRTDFVNFPHVATVPYYAERKVWVWCEMLGAENRERARTTSRWVVTTEPPETMSAIEAWRRRIKNEKIHTHPDMSWLKESGFQQTYRSDGFTIYRKQQPGG